MHDGHVFISQGIVFMNEILLEQLVWFGQSSVATQACSGKSFQFSIRDSNIRAGAASAPDVVAMRPFQWSAVMPNDGGSVESISN
jgi:hypothetical protein